MLCPFVVLEWRTCYNGSSENHAGEEKMHGPFAALIRRAEAYQMHVHE